MSPRRLPPFGSGSQVPPAATPTTCPRILCAAIWVKDSQKHEHGPLNIEDGFVICGRRHHDCLATLMDCFPEHKGKDAIQGFISSDNRFLNRKEALVVAMKARQIHAKHPPYDMLVSEDLY